MTDTIPNGKKVMIFGTFDHFHAGHDDLIKQAKKLGDYLIVVVARDETVRKIKHHSPDHSEKERLHILKNHPLVDKAVLGDHEDKLKVILKHRPDIIALGYDQFVFTYLLPGFLIRNKLNTHLQRLEAFQPEIFKSSLIKRASLCSEN